MGSVGEAADHVADRRLAATAAPTPGDVGAGAEVLALAAKVHGSDLAGVGGEVVEHADQRLHGRAVERVAPVGTVDGQLEDGTDVAHPE